VSKKIRIFIPKNCLKSILWSQVFVSKEQNDIQAGNSGYSLHSSGQEEVQLVACTEQGKGKFNIVPLLCNYSTSAIFNTNSLHNVCLFL